MHEAPEHVDPEPEPLRIGIHLEFESTYFRKVIVGVRRYLSLYPHIHTHFIGTLHKDGVIVDSLRTQRFDGFLGMIMDRQTGTLLRELNPKVVSVTSATTLEEIPKVSSDDYAVGRMGCAHLIERGYQNLLFIGGSYEYGKLRLKGAREYAAEHSLSIAHHPCLEHNPGKVSIGETPVGIICETDAMASSIIRQVLEQGYSIPGEVAVVGGDDDPLSGALSDIPITTVRLNEERVGYEAMRIIHNWIQGESPPKEPLLIDPVRLIPRASTGVSSIRDERLQSWLDYLEAHLQEIRSVKELSAQLNISRRVLERKFREELNCSVYEKITEFRIQRANQLMRDTRKPLSEISDLCGFGDPRTFGLTFKRVEGVVPSVRRRQFIEEGG